jgi:hypothetical protein
MILTLIAISFFVIGVILILIDSIAHKKIFRGEIGHDIWITIYHTGLKIWGLYSCLLGVVFISLCSLSILGAHIGVDNDIRQDNIRYESLCERLEIINSDYEDVSKSEVIDDIAEWNIKVTNSQYWAKNPWTSWFHSQKRTDNLRLIEY